MSTTFCANGTVGFTFFFVMRLNITIVTSYHCYHLLIVILVTYIFSSLKLENWLKKHVSNVAKVKYGFVKLVAILFPLIQDVIMWFLLIYQVMVQKAPRMDPNIREISFKYNQVRFLSIRNIALIDNIKINCLWNKYFGVYSQKTVRDSSEFIFCNIPKMDLIRSEITYWLIIWTWNE